MPEPATVVYWGTLTVKRGVLSLRAERPDAPDSQTGRDSDRGTTSGRRILMIEDDAALAGMYQRRLERDGHQVVLASTGADGMDLARREAFDLTFLDLGLPDRDGIDLLHDLRAEVHDAAVVVLTNFSDTQARKRSLELGARAYVIKADVTPAWLAQHVDTWI